MKGQERTIKKLENNLKVLQKKHENTSKLKLIPMQGRMTPSPIQAAPKGDRTRFQDYTIPSQHYLHS